MGTGKATEVGPLSVEAAIHERWAGYAPLARLVPVDRFCTGRVPGRDASGRVIDPPYVVLEPDADVESQRLVRTSAGTLLVETCFRFHIYSCDVDVARTIGHTILECFQGAEVAWDEGRVQDCRPRRQALAQLDDGTWRLTRDFTIRYETRA